jgi:4-amino-4-deoxy-L-arabinose transferase-like glycosyltransferase
MLAENVLNIHNLNFFFQELNLAQKAPPIFILLTKILTKFLGTKEYVFRIIPFISAILDILLFYLVSKIFLKNKFAVIFANVLFAINSQLIYYAHSFKQYSSDILATLIIIYSFFQIDIEFLTKKKILLISLALGIIALFSFSIIFIFPIIFLIIAFDNPTKKKICNLIYISIPFALVCILYLLQSGFSNSETHKELIFMWKNIENCGFLSIDISRDVETIKNNLIFFFDNNNPLWIFILSTTGTILLFIKERKNGLLFIGIIALLIVASFLEIYPFSERVILFLLPIQIILIAKNIDFKINNKILHYLITLLVLCIITFSFRNYNQFFLKQLYQRPLDKEFTLGRDVFKIIKENLKKDEIIIFIQHDSLTKYYTKFFNIQNTVDNREQKVETKELYYNYLDELQPKQSYIITFLYLPYIEEKYKETHDYTKNNKKVFIEDIVHYKDILYMYRLKK